MWRVNPQKCGRVLKGAIDLVRAGHVKTIEPLTVMGFDELENAFRQMQAGKHVGKMVLTAGADDVVQMAPREMEKLSLDSNVSYLLSGGLGGLGRSMAEHLVRHGARHLIFLSRSGATKPEAAATLKKLEEMGCHVAAYACDVSRGEAVESAVAEAQKSFPPIKGVVQGAMALQDAVLSNMTHQQFMSSILPKVQGSWNLHQHLPKDMDFFVMLSSSAGIGGNIGQGNYAAGNAFQDALAHHRRGQGLRATTLDVGMVAGVGVVAESAENKSMMDNLRRLALEPLREDELLAFISAAILGRTPKHGGRTGGNREVPAQVVTGLATGGMVTHHDFDIPHWFNDGKFAHVKHIDTQMSGKSSEAEGDSLQMQLTQATSLAVAAEAVAGAMVKKIAKSMMMAPEDIETSRPVSTYGIDSLVAVELRTWTLKEAQSDVSVFEIMGNQPMLALAKTIATRSKSLAAGVATA